MMQEIIEIHFQNEHRFLLGGRAHDKLGEPCELR